MLRKKKLKKKPRKRKKRKKPRRKPLRSSTMLLIETKMLLIKQELRLSKQLSPKKVTKRKVPIPLKLTMIRQLLKHLLQKKLVSKLTTIKEEEPLQLPETP